MTIIRLSYCIPIFTLIFQIEGLLTCKTAVFNSQKLLLHSLQYNATDCSCAVRIKNHIQKLKIVKETSVIRSQGDTKVTRRLRTIPVGSDAVMIHARSFSARDDLFIQIVLNITALEDNNLILRCNNSKESIEIIHLPTEIDPTLPLSLQPNNTNFSTSIRNTQNSQPSLPSEFYDVPFSLNIWFQIVVASSCFIIALILVGIPLSRIKRKKKKYEPGKDVGNTYDGVSMDNSEWSVKFENAYSSQIYENNVNEDIYQNSNVNEDIYQNSNVNEDIYQNSNVNEDIYQNSNVNENIYQNSNVESRMSYQNNETTPELIYQNCKTTSEMIYQNY